MEETEGINYYWKFSQSKFNNKSSTGYYYCSDTSCKVRGYYIFKFDKNNKIYENIKNESFIIKTSHNLTYEDHTFIINKIIQKD